LEIVPAASIQPSASASSGNAPSKMGIGEASRQFEAMLITELLRSAHGEDSGWLGSGGDGSFSNMTGMAEEYLAQALSARGGLGLAEMVEKGLRTTEPAR